jgi:quercetin dioxygenase-like cupin family protein
MEVGRIAPVDLKSDFRRGTFTGRVWGDPVAPAGASTTINHVHFEAGARTHWHRHAGGQVLVVTAGRGHVCSKDGSRRAIGEGDVVWIEPGEEHWHGAESDHFLAHLAISLGQAEWLEAVSDAEYAGS